MSEEREGQTDAPTVDSGRIVDGRRIVADELARLRAEVARLREERDAPKWPRGYIVRIEVEALEGASVCATLREMDPDGTWVVMREVNEYPTVDAALRALAGGGDDE